MEWNLNLLHPVLGSGTNRTLSSNGIVESMLELIGWHVPRNDYLSYVTRAVRVTDQIIPGIPNNSTIRPLLVTRLIERLDYEADLVINPPPVSHFLGQKMTSSPYRIFQF